MTDAVLLYVTTPDQSCADLISETLLREGLIACANRIPGMESKYHWHGRIETAREHVLILKTTADRADRARARVQSLHPYETPCVLILPIQGGSAEYLKWLKGSLG